MVSFRSWSTIMKVSDSNVQIHTNQGILRFNSKSNCLAISASLASCSFLLSNSLSYSALGLYGLGTGCNGIDTGGTFGTGNGELVRGGFPSFGSGNGEEYLCVNAGSGNSPMESSLPKNGRCPSPGGEVCPYVGYAPGTLNVG